MQEIRCDRCNKLTCRGVHNDHPHWITMSEEFQSSFRGNRVDLCGACMKELVEWVRAKSRIA